MKKNNWSGFKVGIIFTVIMLILVFGACAQQPSSSTQPAGQPQQSTQPTATNPIVIKYANPGTYSDMTANDLTDDWFISELEKRSNGRVKFDKYYGGVLGTFPEMLKLVQTGGAQTGILIPTMFEQFLPYDTPLNSIFFLVKMPEDAVKIAYKVYDEFPFMQEQYAKQNLMMMYPKSAGPYYINTTKPVKTLADMKGVKLYTWGSYVPKLISAAGAVPVSVNMPDIYDSISKGLLDGRFASYETSIMGKIYEVAEYWTLGDIGSIMAVPFVMNLDTYNSLPDDIRGIVDDLRKEVIDKEVGFIVQQRQVTKKYLEERNATFFDFPAEDLKKWRDATGDLTANWIKEMEEKNLGDNAKKLTDSIIQQAAAGW